MAASGVSFETGHAEIIHDAQLDYYGQRLATASSDCSVKVFDVSKEDQLVQLAELRGHDGPVWQLAWAHPSFGRLLATVGYDRRVIVWKEAGPQQQQPEASDQEQWVKTFQDSSHQGGLTSVAWAPHSYGLVLAVGSADGCVSVFSHNPQSQQWSRQSFLAHKGGVNSVSWGPDVRTGALALANPNAAAAGAPAGAVRPPLRLLSSGCDGRLQMWAWSAEERGWRAQRDAWAGGDNRHSAAVLAGGVQGVGALSGAGGTQGSGDADWIRDAQWAPGLGLPRGTLASAAEDGSVVVWTEQPNGQWRKRWRTTVPGGRVWKLSWSPLGDLLAVSQGNGQVSLWREAADGDWRSVGNAASASGPAPSSVSQGPAAAPSSSSSAVAAPSSAAVPSVAAAVSSTAPIPAPVSHQQQPPAPFPGQAASYAAPQPGGVSAHRPPLPQFQEGQPAPISNPSHFSSFGANPAARYPQI